MYKLLVILFIMRLHVFTFLNKNENLSKRVEKQLEKQDITKMVVFSCINFEHTSFI